MSGGEASGEGSPKCTFERCLRCHRARFSTRTLARPCVRVLLLAVASGARVLVHPLKYLSCITTERLRFLCLRILSLKNPNRSTITPPITSSTRAAMPGRARAVKRGMSQPSTNLPGRTLRLLLLLPIRGTSRGITSHPLAFQKRARKRHSVR